MRQAEADLGAARDNRKTGHHEWACFLAQQAGEKAAKALHEAEGVEAWGHSVAALLDEFGEVPEAVVEAAKALDKHYVATRYPSAHQVGAPVDAYTKRESATAIEDAATVVDHVRGQLPAD